MLRNPYLNRSMIRAVDQFFGRQREVQRVMSRVGALTPQSVSVVGERRVGKSSLLWHLVQEEVRARYLEDPERYIFTLLDFQGQQHLDREGFCRAFSRQLVAAGNGLKLNEAEDLSGLERAIAVFQDADLRLICLFDEFETVTRNDVFGTEFFGFLRSLANAYPVAFVTASRRELQSLCHTREIATSPFFNIFTQVRLGPLLEAETRELIAAPSREAGIALKRFCGPILELSGQLPLFVQMACSAAFECLAEEGSNKPDWEMVEQRFREEADSHFRYLWEHFDEAEQELAIRLAAGALPAPEQIPVTRKLTADGYVARENGRERLFSRVFVRFLHETVPELHAEPVVAPDPTDRFQPAPVPQVEPVPRGESPYPRIIGQSAAIRRVFTLVQHAAAADVTVLLSGATGTGKELVARTIHDHSPRRDQPFVVVNCGAIAEHLQESELFGHKKGAFTDAVADREGLFEAADKGTLFLDEIGETAPATQVKLLRVLQEREIRRVGENRVRQVDVRLICATNRELQDEVETGRFRQDLYYRLYVLAIPLPPLRQRREDIPLLIRHFLGNQGRAISPQALSLLRGYDWPGNIRELENQLASARAMAVGERIEAEHLWPRVQQVQPGPAVGTKEPLEEADPGRADALDMGLKDAREIFERTILQNRIEAYGWDLEEAARSLELSRSRLYELIRRHGLREG